MKWEEMRLIDIRRVIIDLLSDDNITTYHMMNSINSIFQTAFRPSHKPHELHKMHKMHKRCEVEEMRDR
jgi:hypothetical protein